MKPQDKIIKDFITEFGIHFKDSKDELDFACEFIREALIIHEQAVREKIKKETKKYNEFVDGL